MKKNKIRIVLLALLTLVVGSCGDKREPISVSESQLVGLWQRTGSQEYWRYASDHTGVTWDEAEDITEEESNLTFRWTLNGDELGHVFNGQMGNQAVSRYYTITQISSTTMKWEDDYGTTTTLNKAGKSPSSR